LGLQVALKIAGVVRSCAHLKLLNMLAIKEMIIKIYAVVTVGETVKRDLKNFNLIIFRNGVTK
jgi:hypothetical protein